MLSTSQGRSSQIAESSNDAVVSKDINGIITDWNAGAGRLFGYTSEEIIGKPVTILIPPDRQDEEREILDRVRRAQHVHYETVRMRKDGGLIEVSIIVAPVKDARGAIVGAVKIARDITEQRRAQERQIILLGEMNHRIRNLFALTNSLVAMTARSAGTPKELAEALTNRLGALSRAHELIRPGFDGSGESVVSETTLDALLRAIFAPYHPGTMKTASG
jgi:PAS domain S-box-containing protein